MTKNMKRMTALACAAMMIASMGITGCGKADGQTKEETKTTAVETPAGTETSSTETIVPIIGSDSLADSVSAAPLS